MDETSLRRLAREHGVPMGTLEKDYALTNLLYIISGFPKLDSMVFKGGTSIKKAHFTDFRFSEDLDFTCLEDVSNDFADFVRDNMGGLDVEFVEVSDLERRDESFKFRVKYNQSTGYKTSVRVDLSLRGDVMGDHPARRIRHFYEGFDDPFSMPVISLEEIMAEKVRAVTYTKHPRHLYDIFYLHNQGVRINPDIVEAKTRSAYNESFDLDTFVKRLPEKAEFWMADLKPFLSAPPPSFDHVSKKALAVISDAMGA